MEIVIAVFLGVFVIVTGVIALRRFNKETRGQNK